MASYPHPNLNPNPNPNPNPSPNPNPNTSPNPNPNPNPTLTLTLPQVASSYNNIADLMRKTVWLSCTQRRRGGAHGATSFSLYRRAMYIREAKLGASSQLAATPTLTPTLLENLPKTCKGNNRGTSNRGTCSGTGVAPVLRLYYRGGAVQGDKQRK